MLHRLKRTAYAPALFAALALAASAQTPPRPAPDDQNAKTNAAQTVSAAPAVPASAAVGDPLEAVRRQLSEQQAEIEQLRATVAEQTRLLRELLARSPGGGGEQQQQGAGVRDAAYAVDGVATTDTLRAATDTLRATADTPRAANGHAQQTPGAAAKNPQTEQPDELARLKKTTETLSRQLGSLSFSGDIRLRMESQFGQLNALANAENPAIVGNELSARHRARVRARLAVRGQLGPQFDWGLRLATGTTPDVISNNQTLTDFFGRKTFALDQAYLSYKPAALPGLRIQGGKFETPWLFTEMTIDNDVSPEGLNETYSRDFKSAGALKNLTLVAWQLPMLERQSAFVLNSAGQVDIDASRRGGRDLALYGAQARVRLELSPRAALTLAAADLNFTGTQFITPAQFFGGTLQLPVTVTIPATATTPAQTITTFATISRDLLVSGSALGVSIGSTNATNRDGRLSSGYNLVDLLGRLELTHSKQWPVTLLFNFVTNTQVRDVVAAGGRTLENKEGQGYWAEFQVGKTRERGDALFSYTFVRIEKDAVLSPFNFSDILQSTDVRVHRLVAAYAADPRVTISLTGLFSQRPNGLLGVFGATPPGSLNRTTTRLQLDTIFRF